MSETTTFDVVIFDKATKEIVAIPGKNLKADTGFRNASTCYATWEDRIDTKNYDLDVVPHGTFKKGDKYQ